MKMKNRSKTGEIVNEIKPTYFIYQTGHIKGAFTVDELIGKCVRNEIHLKSEKILFCPASLTNNYYYLSINKVWMTLDELKQTGHHQELYSNLAPLQQINTIIQHPPIPHKTMPHKKSYGLTMYHILNIINVIISKLLFIFISLHFIIPLILCTLIYCILHIFCCSDNKIALFSPYSLWIFIWDSLILKHLAKPRFFRVFSKNSTTACSPGLK